MPRFFSEQPLFLGEMVLPDPIYHHWCKVLRAKVGDTGVLFDGTGGEWQATLCAINKKQASVKLSQHNPSNRTLPYHLTLGLVISRGERMDYAIQKATEMGVSSVQLLHSARGQVTLKYDRDLKKIDHWQKIAISACEQCGLNIIPNILPPLSLTDWVAQCPSTLKLVLGFADSALQFGAMPDSIALLVGAEGGLSPEEVTCAKQHGFVPWCLGERVLRTETAPIVAMASLATLHGLHTCFTSKNMLK